VAFLCVLGPPLRLSSLLLLLLERRVLLIRTRLSHGQMGRPRSSW